ncbi:MAG TPA: DHH family phosphoesterase, partial [Polyangiaceae bacterium LLY-WYZ-15_(1-7)]|nr:DHH family phosphoesterase [Polyangiaceae bacterium LLY-WYZ-15_(1-7)]
MTTLITTHENADLDALASTVAVRKLHPEAIVGFGRRLNPSTRAFLALHRGRFPSEHCDHVDLDAVDALILTDVRRRGRVPHVASLLARRDADPTALRVEVWDHHEASTDDLPADAIHVAPLGAVTTLLVETLRERGLPVDPIEATLFALGIHDDTGSLSFPTSTPRDARALAWLMEQGAELTVVKRYLAPPLDERQRQLLRALLEGMAPLAGPAAVVTLPLPKKVRGIARVCSEALALTEYGAFFAIFDGPTKRQVIARARHGALDVGEVLAAVGGGGHTGAAAAVVRDLDVAALRARLAERVEAQPPRQRVRDVMSAPVHVLSREWTVQEAGEALERWGVSGAPVVDV